MIRATSRQVIYRKDKLLVRKRAIDVGFEKNLTEKADFRI